MTIHWISCRAFTVRVTADEEGYIVKAAPLVRRFIGQPVANLIHWAQGRGGLRHEHWEVAA